ncbi:MAG: hypothetical protein KHW59_04785 [Clostridiales bacterium]|nr:hypothetical protein [Clostridiales bacterium]
MSGSKFISDGRGSKASHLITALGRALESFTLEPQGMFGRRAEIQCGNLTLDSEQFDFEFEVPFDDDTEANECTITIYNLTKNTIDVFRYNSKITITAGYKGDTGVVFSGYISKVTTKKEGTDKVTTIYALDDMDLQERDIVDVTYAAGTTASYILRDLISRISLPLAVFSVRRDWTYKDETKVDGGLMENIRQYAEVCGISVYINKGKIYARHISEGDNIYFTVSESSGLIESPEEFEEEVTAEDYKDVIRGYKCKMLLQHRMNTAAVIDLESVNVSGRFRVRSGKHIFSPDACTTEVEVI